MVDPRDALEELRWDMIEKEEAWFRVRPSWMLGPLPPGDPPGLTTPQRAALNAAVEAWQRFRDASAR